MNRFININFNKIFNISPISMIVYDYTYNIKKINLSFKSLSEYTDIEIIKYNIFDIFILSDNDINNIKNNPVENLSTILITKSGNKIRCLINTEIMKYENNRTCVLVFIINLESTLKIQEELKLSEQRYEQLLELFPMPIVIYNYNTKNIIYINTLASNLVKHDKKEMIGNNIYNFFYDEWLVNLIPSIQNNIKNDIQEFSEKVFYDNTDHYYDFTIKKTIYNNEIIIIVIAEDKSEKMYLEDHLKNAAKLEAIGLLAGGVAHDFNNILTIIRGYTHMILNKDLKNTKSRKLLKVITKLNKIDNAGQRAESLTAQLLAFGRKQHLNPKIINVNKLINEDQDFLKRTIREDIEISFYLDENLNNIKADKNQISQVIINLILNARDAIRKKGHINIETKNIIVSKNNLNLQIKEGNYVTISISDNGMGMDKKTMDRIFEPFFTTKEIGKGTGLGLSTVYGIVRQSNGYITVDSKLNIGTTFTIYFPSVIESSDELTYEKNELEKLTGNEKILVVEDEDDVKNVIVETLIDANYNVYYAENGLNAIDLIKNNKLEIDLLLTDIIMPKINGKELAEQLLKLIPSIKILYMSGYTDSTIINNKFNFIQKPLTPTSILKKIREVLDSTK